MHFATEGFARSQIFQEFGTHKTKTHHKDISVFLPSNRIVDYAKDGGEERLIIMQCVSIKNLVIGFD